MAQYQNFSFEPPSRLEAVAQHAHEKKGNCHHRPGSCSDSALVATPADGVFGSEWLGDVPSLSCIRGSGGPGHDALLEHPLSSAKSPPGRGECLHRGNCFWRNCAATSKNGGQPTCPLGLMKLNRGNHLQSY